MGSEKEEQYYCTNETWLGGSSLLHTVLYAFQTFQEKNSECHIVFLHRSFSMFRGKRVG